MAKKGSAEEAIRTIKRKTRRQYSAEEKIRIVLEGMRGEESIAELCRREGSGLMLVSRQSCSHVSSSSTWRSQTMAPNR